MLQHRDEAGFHLAALPAIILSLSLIVVVITVCLIMFAMFRAVPEIIGGLHFFSGPSSHTFKTPPPPGHDIDITPFSTPPPGQLYLQTPSIPRTKVYMLAIALTMTNIYSLHSVLHVSLNENYIIGEDFLQETSRLCRQWILLIFSCHLRMQISFPNALSAVSVNANGSKLTWPFQPMGVNGEFQFWRSP